MQRTVHVIATTFEGTCAALAAAVPLARGAACKLVVLVPQIASADDDAAQRDERSRPFMRHYADVARQLDAAADVQLCPCQTMDDLVARIVAEDSHVVVGGPVGRWLTSPEERFANRLARAGCHVVFAASGANTTQRRIIAA